MWWRFFFFSLIICGTRSGRAAAPPPLRSLLVFLPALRTVPPRALWGHREVSVPQQAGIVGVSKAQVTPSQVKSNRPVPASHPSKQSGKLLLPVLEFLPSVPVSRCVSVQAAPSELPQLPVPAKRSLSLTLDSGLMLFQRVLPCCAFGLHYLIC